MLSTASIYALRAMVCLAENQQRPLTSSAIAQSINIQSEYLAKVLGTLSRSGLADSRRGRQGGFTLARSSTDITIMDILHATETAAHLRPQVFDGQFTNQPDHPLQQAINLVADDMERRFAGVTLDNITTLPAPQ